MQSFGELIRKARISAGLSQVELAAIIGVAKSTLSLYESGGREPDVETIKKIATALDVDPNYLLGIEHVSTQIQASLTEIEMIKKYRLLDQRGQQAVLDTLNREFSYVSSEENQNPLSHAHTPDMDGIKEKAEKYAESIREKHQAPTKK